VTSDPPVEDDLDVEEAVADHRDDARRDRHERSGEEPVIDRAAVGR
jgi:hypothetical protein